MAQRVQVLLLDDLDGGKANETVKFSLDGTFYEIDLSTAHAGELRDALAAYVAAGRRLPGRGVKLVRRGPVNSDSAKIRAWAQATGREVSDRGRIPAPLREAYYAAH
ncbi:MAG: Lsr2 family protein [Bifidobacteriaceae bacterium]|jgi:hypothetical protein|nr:Lsr2 family protein [Bifidobacteriaceae bacterium]